MDDDAAPATVTEALDLLRGRGYTTEFELVDGELRGDDGRAACTVERAVVEHLYRFEGPSDPGDEMVVYGVRDPVSGARGTLAAAFGPAADPELSRHLAGLHARFRSQD